MPKLGSGAATGGAPMTSPRPPVPGQPAAAPRPASGGGMLSGMGGFFPEKGSQAQYDMIMQLVQAGMTSAQGANSPLASFLAPLAGAVIGGGATRKNQDAKAAANDRMSQAVLGDLSGNPQVQGYIEVMNNPDAPDHLKKIAQSRLDKLINPKTAKTSARRSGGGRISSGSGQKSSRLYGEYDIGGILHGRDNYGNMTPYKGPDGRPVPAQKGKGNSASSGGGSVLDELTALTGTAAPDQPQNPAMDEDDPLGILGLPPA